MKKLLSIAVLSSCVWGQTAVSPTINPYPTRQFGHPSLVSPITQASPNLVEGREFNSPGQIALDTSVNPPILYVADIGNNRVLAFKNTAALTAGNFADLVVGQQDLVSTLTEGSPSSTLTTGLSNPTGVAVDSAGNLYVADAGNNRIMRFPKPFSQPTGIALTPDLVIGQKSFGTGNSANQGGNCSAQTLGFAQYGSVFVTGLAIDLNGNLWTTDPVNYRVLMYPAASLAQGTQNPAATVVLGQNNFTTCTAPNTNIPQAQLIKNGLVQPASLAFDSSGNLYVADSYARVLYYAGPNFTVGQPAARVLGIYPTLSAGQTLTYPNQYSLGAPNSVGNLISPNGVFTSGNHLYVADTPSHRIVEYDVPSSWPAETSAIPSPQMLAVFGQPGFSSGSANQGLAQPNQYTLSSPFSGAFAGSTMWVSDSGNNRILEFPNVAPGNGASAVVGQTAFAYDAPNLIEGKELFLSGLYGSSSGIVVDKNSNPPHLYVADPGNNRILCFNDVRKVSSGTSPTFADRVIGQPDLKSSIINYPSGQALSPSAQGLYNPIGLAVDNNGNLYVADSSNGRVLRFPAPFAQPAGQQATANLVLGQSNFTTVIQNVTQNSMHTPYGIALFAGSDANATPLAGGIAVSDPYYNRVLIFKKGAGGDFTSGQTAAIVIGQGSFSTVTSGTGNASFNSPRGIASDTSDRLYVADTNNNRVQAFTQAPQTFGNGPAATQTYPNLNAPYAVVVSSITTELWVANTNQGVVYRYPEYNTCGQGACAFTSTLVPGAAPIGLALDATDNVIVGDAANRMTFFYPASFFRNAANFNVEGMAPGMLTVLGRLGLPMSIQDGQTSTNPWPTTLSDLQISVNGVLAPIYATNKAYGAIYFQVPYEAPTSGTVPVIVSQVSTGAVLAVGSFQMVKTNPGFFTTNANGQGPVAATNKDGTVNGPSNPAARGDAITFYLTGLGQVTGAPADGYAPTSAAGTSTNLTSVIIEAAAATVSYSGVGAFAGGWQVNATIPSTAAPGLANSVVLTYLGVNSNIGGTTSSDGITPGPDQKLQGSAITTVWVK